MSEAMKAAFDRDFGSRITGSSNLGMVFYEKGYQAALSQPTMLRKPTIITPNERDMLKNATCFANDGAERDWSHVEPEFDAMNPDQERFAIEFCEEIAGKKGDKPLLPDPVRLLEMAQALYMAEKSCIDPQQPSQPSCEPVAWLHTMDNTQGSTENTALTDITKSSTHPFGRAGIDYSEEFPVTSVPLFSAPPDYESIKSEHSRKMLFVEAFEESSNRVIQELKSDRGELRKSAFEITCELGLLRAENAQLKEDRDALKEQLASIKSAVYDDKMAITYQSISHYRSSLIRLCK